MTEQEKPLWTFLSRHAQALVCIARDPDVRLREIAGALDITSRAAQHLVNELCAAGAVTRERRGRRNHYAIEGSYCLHHPLEGDCTIDQLLAALERRSA